MIEITGEIPQAAIKTNAMLKSEVERLSTGKNAMEQALAKLREDIDKLKAQLEEMKQRRKELQRKFDTLYPITILSLMAKEDQEQLCHFDISDILDTVRGLK